MTELENIWRDGLVIPAFGDELAVSLVGELAAYVERPYAEVWSRCAGATAELAQLWERENPQTQQETERFYEQCELYLYELTWWHGLTEDASALAQAKAWQYARRLGVETFLEFGSGIGSLGILAAGGEAQVTLAEVNPQLLAYAHWRFAQRGLTGEFIDLNREALPPGQYEFIAALDVLEHVADLGKTMTQLTAALQIGGTLYIHLPPAGDESHPMHLRAGTAEVLAQLAGLGLWLVEASADTVVVRKGGGPVYALNEGMSVQDGVLLSNRPLLAMQVNAQALRMFERLVEPQTAQQVSPSPRMMPSVTQFLAGCVKKRLVSKRPSADHLTPTVSVIIPARDRPEQTRACVRSLLALDYPAEKIEILVMDDASERPLAEELAGLPVRVLRTDENMGQSAARNWGAREATRTWLAFIDNDCVARPDWLAAMAPYMAEAGVDMLGGRVLAPVSESAVAEFEAARSPLDMGKMGGFVGPSEPVAYFPTCNFLVRREAMLALEGFQPEMLLGEDVDFVWRGLESGRKALYVPEAEIVHHHRIKLDELLKRRMAYASSEADLVRRHPANRRVMMVPRLGVLGLAALGLVGIWWPLSLMLCLVVGGLIGYEVWEKQTELIEKKVALSWRKVVQAVLREHEAGFYHLAANLLRYYSLPLALLGLLIRPLLLPLLVIGLVPALVDYARHQPNIGRVTYTCLMWLEMGAYQLGVWQGCWQRREWRPLWPQIRWSR